MTHTPHSDLEAGRQSHPRASKVLVMIEHDPQTTRKAESTKRMVIYVVLSIVLLCGVAGIFLAFLQDPEIRWEQVSHMCFDNYQESNFEHEGLEENIEALKYALQSTREQDKRMNFWLAKSFKILKKFSDFRQGGVLTDDRKAEFIESLIGTSAVFGSRSSMEDYFRKTQSHPWMGINETARKTMSEKFPKVKFWYGYLHNFLRGFLTPEDIKLPGFRRSEEYNKRMLLALEKKLGKLCGESDDNSLLKNYRDTWQVYKAVIAATEKSTKLDISYEQLKKLRVLQDKCLSRKLGNRLLEAYDALFWIESCVTCHDPEAPWNAN